MAVPWRRVEDRARRGARIEALAARIRAECPPGELAASFGDEALRAENARRAAASAAAIRKARTTEPEKRAHAARMTAGRFRAAAEGHHVSGPAPYGYRRNRERRLVEDPTEAPVVRLAFRLALRLPVCRVAAELNLRGLRTRSGRPWSRQWLAWILKNETYVGRVHFGAIRARGRHPAIVAPIVFNKVQKRLRDRHRRGVIARAVAKARRAT